MRLTWFRRTSYKDKRTCFVFAKCCWFVQKWQEAALLQVRADKEKLSPGIASESSEINQKKDLKLILKLDYSNNIVSDVS